MSAQRHFRYHALDVDDDRVLDSFDSQAEATDAVIRVGESIDLQPGQCHNYAVRIESLATGDTYDIPLEVRNTAPLAGPAVQPTPR